MSTDQDQIVFEEQNERFGYFTQMPNVVLTSTILNPTEKCIYGILRRYASMPKGAMPSVPTICVEANISRTTYNRAIKTFIRSTKNPKPQIPLITSIHRANQSNLFKIHKLTDELVSKLKPIIEMPEKEREVLKQKHKKKKTTQGTGQNDIPFKNTREYQNEPHRVPVKMISLGISNRHTSNNELSNIEQQQEKKKKDVVVDFLQTEFGTSPDKKTIFGIQDIMKKHGKGIEEVAVLLHQIVENIQVNWKIQTEIKSASNILSLLLDSGKDIEFVTQQMKAHFQAKNEAPHNPLGALIHGITNGWTGEITSNQQPARELRNYDVAPTEAMLRRKKLLALQMNGGDLS